jgi:F-type H+-transporting ATPase subunit delta
MIGKEYAKSLVETHSNLDTCMEEFKVFISFYDTLNPIMKSPGISYKEKHDIIDKSFKNFSKDFLCFIYVVIDNNRFSYLNEIFSEFKKMYDEKNNIATCDVYSSVSLKEKEKKEIISYLEKTFNKKVMINELIDENIIGIKLVCEGETIDYSLESRINKMRVNI